MLMHTLKTSFERLALWLVLPWLLLSCADKKEDQAAYLPSSIGAMHSVLVVAETELWEGVVGDSIRSILYAPIPGLSMIESQWDIQHVTPGLFKGTVQQSRSVILVQKDSTTSAYMKEDVFSRPQQVGVVKGPDAVSIAAAFSQKAPDFITAFEALEMKEQQTRFSRSLLKTENLNERWGITLKMPSAYVLGKETEDFLWFDRPIKTGTLNVIVYALPRNGRALEERTTTELVASRDSVVGIHIPGPDVPGKRTFMATDSILTPYVYPAQAGVWKGLELRGMWDMRHYPMAGPFVAYYLDQPELDRILVLEGFVFAPDTLKRDLLFELEGILSSAQ